MESSRGDGLGSCGAGSKPGSPTSDANGASRRSARPQLACAFEHATPLAQTLTRLFEALDFYARGEADQGKRARRVLALYGRPVGTQLNNGGAKR